MKSARLRSAHEHDRRSGELIASVLFWGGLAGIAVVAAGVLLYAASGGFHGEVAQAHRLLAEPPAVTAGEFTSIGAVLRGVTARPIDPLAIIMLGLVLLLITPVLGVAVSVPAFIGARDVRYAIIASIVLSMLAVSLLFLGGIG